jgi:hypothetical protein
MKSRRFIDRTASAALGDPRQHSGMSKIKSGAC